MSFVPLGKTFCGPLSSKRCTPPKLHCYRMQLILSGYPGLLSCHIITVLEQRLMLEFNLSPRHFQWCCVASKGRWNRWWGGQVWRETGSQWGAQTEA